MEKFNLGDIVEHILYEGVEWVVIEVGFLTKLRAWNGGCFENITIIRPHAHWYVKIGNIFDKEKENGRKKHFNKTA